MKGQFFIIGALFVCTILYFGLGPSFDISVTGSEDMNVLAGNLQKELPHALNIGINASAPISTLRNFTLFSIDSLRQGRIDLGCYWLVFRYTGGQVNVSAGNFMGEPKVFYVNVSGVSNGIYAADGAVNSSMFDAAGPTFDVSVTVDGETSSFTQLTRKTSIFSQLTLSRSGNIISKEILA
ncbi:MAG: hypothetical protein JXC85_04030 [Candidatus Aenigmarchaeota archaeon]|nr:hypothetical protein [Candidatus Aenigmarchaeota archaeon]